MTAILINAVVYHFLFYFEESVGFVFDEVKVEVEVEVRTLRF